MKRLGIVLLMSIFMMGVTVRAADESVKSFVATAPDTVMQGQKFTVTYTLSATTWDKDGSKVQRGKGFSVEDMSYDMKAGQQYHQLIATVTYLTSRTGVVELPGMVVMVNKQPVRSAPKSIYVRPHPQYGEEMAYAHAWLLKNGQHPDSICLRMAEEDKDFWLFHDRWNHCFCLMAKKSVWPLIDIPVLAYSTESAINGSSDRNYANMVQPYRKQIAVLQSLAGKVVPADKQPYTRKLPFVAPLLGRLQWGQEAPYNYYAPTMLGRKFIVGCVPLAVAMVMNYYQWPEQGQSHVYYQPDNNVYKMDFSQCNPQWSTYQETYEAKDTLEACNLSKLLTALGVSLDANFNEVGTSASLTNVKHLLCNNLKYLGKATLYYHKLTDSETASYIYQELDQRRPCIVTNEGHAFVCDGYQGDFLHYNMGWRGYYNGFYRLKLGCYETAESSSLILIKGVLGGIEPQREDGMSKVVILKKAGTLAECLSDEEKENLIRLSISGPINSADVCLLRKMAGATADKPFESWHGGSLRELDLDQAVIMDDDTPYLTQKATGSFSTTSTKTNASGVSYDKKSTTFYFDTMTEKEWKQFKNMVGVKHEGLFYTRTDDNQYWANYICSKDAVGAFMFADCSSLHSIILPETTRKIDSYAFFRCSSLQQIRLPEHIEEAGKTPFSNCTSLEIVEAPRGFKPKGLLYEKCSPIMKKLTLY